MRHFANNPGMGPKVFASLPDQIVRAMAYPSGIGWPVFKAIQNAAPVCAYEWKRRELERSVSMADISGAGMALTIITETMTGGALPDFLRQGIPKGDLSAKDIAQLVSLSCRRIMTYDVLRLYFAGLSILEQARKGVYTGRSGGTVSVEQINARVNKVLELVSGFMDKEMIKLMELARVDPERMRVLQEAAFMRLGIRI